MAVKRAESADFKTVPGKRSFIPLMKLICFAILILLTGLASAAEKRGLNIERLMQEDLNRDGKLSKEEAGERFWARAAAQDANGDGILDAAEIAALLSGKERVGADQARPGGANLAFEVKEFQASNHETLRYSLYVPKERSAPLPLVLCLHGSGGGTEAANLLASPASQAKHPCIVMAPACDGRFSRWALSEFRSSKESRSVMPEMMEALDRVIAETQADPTRIYITGQSMGGVGTWGVISAHPTRFAAAVPVCGIWQTADAPKMDGVPIWAFHGDQDEAVPVSGSREMIAALKAAKVSPEPKYTEFAGVGHGSWDPAYEMEELWNWMFAQRRGQL
jgi:predicted peptidase